MAALPPPTSIVSASVPDWSREQPQRYWDPSRKLLKSLRRYQLARRKRSVIARLEEKWWVLAHRFWSVVTQAEIHLNTKIGGGLIMMHPNGIVIHPDTVIGPNCLIFQQVTIGETSGKKGVATIGGHVDIGAGAKILGPVHISDHAVIGANAVVTKDVPEYAVVMGVPATIRSYCQTRHTTSPDDANKHI